MLPPAAQMHPAQALHGAPLGPQVQLAPQTHLSTWQINYTKIYCNYTLTDLGSLHQTWNPWKQVTTNQVEQIYLPLQQSLGMLK